MKLQKFGMKAFIRYPYVILLRGVVGGSPLPAYLAPLDVVTHHFDETDETQTERAVFSEG